MLLLVEQWKQSGIGGAIVCTLKLWSCLVRYAEDGRFKIDNNLIENSIRSVALGRKNYLFAGSHHVAQQAAIIYSLPASCKINSVEPFKWLRHVSGLSRKSTEQTSVRTRLINYSVRSKM